MRIKKSKRGLLVFPEGDNEFKAFKMWLNVNASERDYRDVVAGCYVIRSHTVADLKAYGFSIQVLTSAQYKKMVKEYLDRNGDE